MRYFLNIVGLLTATPIEKKAIDFSAIRKDHSFRFIQRGFSSSLYL